LITRPHHRGGFSLKDFFTLQRLHGFISVAWWPRVATVRRR
jgi:hypothetical protein